MYQYLEVTFGDNDFGWTVRDAMKRLWGYIHQNNAHHLEGTKRTISRLFKDLHDKGLLIPMLARLVDCEDAAQNVEFTTRGIHDMDDWPESIDSHKVPESTGSITGYYLHLEIKFRNNRNFTKKCQNGEHAWLDLSTGDADTF